MRLKLEIKLSRTKKITETEIKTQKKRKGIDVKKLKPEMDRKKVLLDKGITAGDKYVRRYGHVGCRYAVWPIDR